MIRNVIKELEFRLRVATDKDVVVLDDNPAVLKENVIYIVAPEEQGVDTEVMISSDTWVNYTIKVHEICHVASMNRQSLIEYPIYCSYDEAESILSKVFPRGMQSIGTAAVESFTYGTSTWVTDTKVYSGLTLTINIRDISPL